MDHYELHGVVIRSAIALGNPAPGSVAELTLTPGAPRPIGFEAPPGMPILDMVVDGRRIHSASDDGAQAVLRIPGLCEFSLAHGSGHVRCIPDPQALPEHLQLLVRGSFLAFYLGLTGSCVLHSSVVEVDHDGTAIAFVAGSGMGKSTMAALLCAEGARFVSDDLLRLDEGSPPDWVGHSAELRLRDPAASLARPDAGWRRRQTVDGRLAVIPARSPHPRGSIAAVVIPSPVRDGGPVRLAELAPVEATLLLAGFPRLERWLAPSVLEAHLDGVSRLAAAVPVFRAYVPWGPPFPPHLGAALLDELGIASDLLVRS